MSEPSAPDRIAAVWSPEARADLRAIDRETAMQILYCADRYLASRTSDVKKLRPELLVVGGQRRGLHHGEHGTHGKAQGKVRVHHRGTETQRRIRQEEKTQVLPLTGMPEVPTLGRRGRRKSCTGA